MRLVRILAMLAVAMVATLAVTATASAATCAGFGYLVTSNGTIQRFSTSTNAVTTTVAWQKHHALTVEFAKKQFVGGIAKGRLHALPALVGQPFDVVNTAAANDAEHRRRDCIAHG